MTGPTFLLGLPALREGALWTTARDLDAPVLISANALSRWTIDQRGYRIWPGFDRLSDAYEEMRALHEAGEIEWSQLSPQLAYEMAFLDD